VQLIVEIVTLALVKNFLMVVKIALAKTRCLENLFQPNSIETLIETGLLLTKESLANRSASNSGNCNIGLSEKFPHGSENRISQEPGVSKIYFNLIV
jgi:hypothetical protein